MRWIIEDGVPIPPKRTGGVSNRTGVSQAFKSMAPGQSVHIDNKDRGAISGAANGVTRNWGWKFVTRQTDNGIRVWRVS